MEITLDLEVKVLTSLASVTWVTGGGRVALANSSLTATRSSSSLEMMTGVMPLDMIRKEKEGVEGREEKWELASYVVVSKLYAISELCGSL